jgi:predicted Zn finger-like uncharacterized protein
MNVQCESCETVYRIDPLKVPESGVRARCTICSNVIEVDRTSEDEAPATDRLRTDHVPSQTDRVAHQLGDAFIPAPDDDDDLDRRVPDIVSVTEDEGDEAGVADFTRKRESEAEREASRRRSVESLPGIIMPPEDDEYAEPQKTVVSSEPFSIPDDIPRPKPDVPPALEASPVDDGYPRRVSRPFSLPRDIAAAAPTPEPSAPPIRPTAPVFRPTPGRPVQAPMTAPPPRPTPSVPSGPSGTPRGPTRPINPFLSRDPGQKARRLARALISDMIVYQPDKRQRALQDGNLAEVFEEEIKKSWEEYVEQVGHELANSTSYFTDALNDLLADGENVF